MISRLAAVAPDCFLVVTPDLATPATFKVKPRQGLKLRKYPARLAFNDGGDDGHRKLWRLGFAKLDKQVKKALLEHIRKGKESPLPFEMVKGLDINDRCSSRSIYAGIHEHGRQPRRVYVGRTKNNRSRRAAHIKQGVNRKMREIGDEARKAMKVSGATAGIVPCRGS